MLYLTSATDKIRITTTTGAALDVHATWTDAPNPIVVGSTYVPGRKNTDITTATVTDVVPSPAAGMVRNVQLLRVVSTDPTLTNDVKIEHTDGVNTATLFEGSLLPGDALTLDERGSPRDAPGLAAVATSGSASDLSTGTLPAARMPAFTGDVTTSAGVVATTIAAHAVTHAKMAQLSGLTLVGNASSSAADHAELTIPQVIGLLGIRLGDFGDGRDGSVTMDGAATVAGCSRSGSTYTATRTCLFGNLTIDVGVTFKPDGWPIFVNTLLTNNGNINSNGGDAAGSTNGTAAVIGARLLPVNGSMGNPSNNAPQVFVTSSGANGGASVGGVGSSGGAGTVGTVGRGGGGGAGGNNNPFTAQGDAGTSSPTVQVAQDINGDIAIKQIALRGIQYNGQAFTLGTAGGAGGNGGGAAGGGQGASGGYVAIMALTVAGAGAWESRGGAGGAGGSTGVTGAGGAGGGGGGAGGVFVLELGGGAPPAINIAGGAGGAGGAGALAGNGANGSNGGPGYALVI